MYKGPSLHENELLDVLSHSSDATAIYTSNDIIIQFANDAMLAFWGKNKNIIGKPLEQAMPELKGKPFKRMLQNVLLTGKTTTGIIPAKINDGQLHSEYYRYEYKAIKNKVGKTICVLHTAANVTQKIIDAEAIEKQWKNKIALTRERFFFNTTNIH